MCVCVCVCIGIISKCFKITKYMHVITCSCNNHQQHFRWLLPTIKQLSEKYSYSRKLISITNMKMSKIKSKYLILEKLLFIRIWHIQQSHWIRSGMMTCTVWHNLSFKYTVQMKKYCFICGRHIWNELFKIIYLALFQNYRQKVSECNRNRH